MVRVAVVLLLLTENLLGQVSPARPEIFTASIMDAENNRVIPNVFIGNHTRKIQTRTDATGSFSLKALPHDTLLVIHDYFERTIIYLTDSTNHQIFLRRKVRLEYDQLSELRESFQKYATKKMWYPRKALKKGIEGEVLIAFELDSAGNIQNTAILKDIGADCGEAARKFIVELPPGTTQMFLDFNSLEFIFPVTFRLKKPLSNFNPPVTTATILNPVLVQGSNQYSPRYAKSKH